MSVFADSMKHRPTVEAVELDTQAIARTVYPGTLVWYTPPVTGGKVAARLIHIDLENKDLELEITATGSNIYRRGERVFHVPYTRVFKRNLSSHYWPRPRFSLQWLDFPTAKERAGDNWKKLSALVRAQG